MSRYSRHPKRKWFGVAPGVRTLADAEREARELAKMPADSPVVKAVLTPILTHNESQLSKPVTSLPTRVGNDPLQIAAVECERQAVEIFADRIAQPEEIRRKYPQGWRWAPYVTVPAKLVAALRRELP